MEKGVFLIYWYEYYCYSPLKCPIYMNNTNPLTTSIFYTGVDDGEHFTEVDKFGNIFEAMCSYYTMINNPEEGEIGVELGVYLYIDSEDEEMETIEFHEF